jgi:hypothetical protein
MRADQEGGRVEIGDGTTRRPPALGLIVGCDDGGSALGQVFVVLAKTYTLVQAFPVGLVERQGSL